MTSRPQSSNFYERLGVAQEASAEEIRKAYKKLALQWHPDKNPNRRDEASSNFQKLAEAYDCLSDVSKRRQYDKYGWLREDAESNYNQRSNYGKTSSTCGSHPPFLDHDFDFTFDRAQRIFESVFGRDSMAPMGLFGLMDSGFEPNPFRMQRRMGSVRRLGGNPFNIDHFGSDFALSNFPKGAHVQSTSTHRTFSSNGQVSTTKTVHCVNGKRTTRVEKAVKGPDGQIHKSVTEHEDLFDGDNSRGFGLSLTGRQSTNGNHVDCITNGADIPHISSHHRYHRELQRNSDQNERTGSRVLGFRSRR